MDKLQQLQALLDAIPGVTKAYYQPPANISMSYPCIVFQRDSALTKFADNRPYKHAKRYQVTVIDKDPGSKIPDLVAELPLCLFSRHFVADQLNHDVFNLYF